MIPAKWIIIFTQQTLPFLIYGPPNQLCHRSSSRIWQRKKNPSWKVYWPNSYQQLWSRNRCFSPLHDSLKSSSIPILWHRFQLWALFYWKRNTWMILQFLQEFQTKNWSMWWAVWKIWFYLKSLWLS